MQFEDNHIYHIYNRGNNSEKVFFEKRNYLFFLNKIRTHILPHASILAWCLMPNHFHLMVYLNTLEIDITKIESESVERYGVKWVAFVEEKRNFNKSIAIMLRSYTRAIQNQENRTGSLFEISTKAKCLSDNSQISKAWFESSFGTIINIEDADKSYPQMCFDYIHQNPVVAHLVKKPELWAFSSFKDYCGLRNGTLIDRQCANEFGLRLS